MEALDEAAVRHVAHLARLKVSDAEVAMFAEQLSSVLGYVAQLNELDMEGTLPTTHAVPVSNVLRDDEIRPSCSVDAALGNAPDRQDAFFRVPKVLDQEPEST